MKRIYILLLLCVTLTVFSFSSAGCTNSKPASTPKAEDENAILHDKLGSDADGALQERPIDDANYKPSVAATTSTAVTTDTIVPQPTNATLALVQAAAMKAARMDAYSYVHLSTADAHWYKYLRLGDEIKRIGYSWDDAGNWTAWGEYLVNLRTGDWYLYQYPKKDEKGDLVDMAEHQIYTGYSKADLFQVDEVKWRSTELLDLVNGYIQNGSKKEFKILIGTSKEDKRSITDIVSEKANIRLEIDKGWGHQDAKYDALRVDVIMDSAHGRQMFYLDEKTGMLICWGSNRSPNGTSFDQIRYYGLPSPDSVSAAAMTIETKAKYPKVNIDPLNR
jgi:hypothetical protein